MNAEAYEGPRAVARLISPEYFNEERKVWSITAWLLTMRRPDPTLDAYLESTVFRMVGWPYWQYLLSALSLDRVEQVRPGHKARRMVPDNTHEIALIPLRPKRVTADTVAWAQEVGLDMSEVEDWQVYESEAFTYEVFPNFLTQVNASDEEVQVVVAYLAQSVTLGLMHPYQRVSSTRWDEGIHQTLAHIRGEHYHPEGPSAKLP